MSFSSSLSLGVSDTSTTTTSGGRSNSGDEKDELTRDVVIIGAGPGGYVAAIRAAQLGLSVTCIESRPTLGGTCLNVGCIPSKALLQSSHLWYELAQHGGEHGIEFETMRFQLKKMMDRKQKIVTKNTAGIAYLFKKHGIQVIHGVASLHPTDPHLVEVRPSPLPETVSQTVRGKHIIIATGSEIIELQDLAAFDHKVICDSTDALSWGSVPRRLAIIGGGVIGLELGSVWARLGAKVDVIEASPRLLGGMDGAFSKFMLKKLKALGVGVHLATTAAELSIEGEENKASATLTLTSHKTKESATSSLTVDKVLVCVGRKPNTQGLGLEGAGIPTDPRGRIVVDEDNRTSIDHIFAIGDVVPGFMLAHKAEEEGMRVAEIIAGHSPASLHHNSIAQVVYTWPELASVGASEEQLISANIPYKSGVFSLKGNARAGVMGDDSGWIRIYAHQATDRLLGVHIAAPSASELIAEASLAMAFSASAEDLARTCHAHPTLSEALREAALAVDDRSLHS